MNLANKYRPHQFSDMMEQSVIVEMIKSLCTSSELDNRNFLFIGPAGCGKAQPLYSKVLTPEGFICMKDVKIGTKVFTGSGNLGTVSGIYPQGIRPIYEIELQDRTKIRVSDEHLNVVYRYNEDKKCREDFCLTTTDLISLFNSSRFKLRIDIPELDWSKKELPIDPYLLGALIGDGSLHDNFQFSNSEQDVIEKVDNILRRDWGKMLRKCNGDNVDYDIVDIDFSKSKYKFKYKDITYDTISSIQTALQQDGYPKFDDETIIRLSCGEAQTIQKHHPELIGAITCTIDKNYKSWTEGDPLKNALKTFGLLCKSTDKHIPWEYLFTAKEDRIRLLQGLFDTDGYIDKSGAVTFTTCSSKLSEDFSFLVRSLGIRDTITSYPTRYKKDGIWIETGSTGYDHSLKIDNSLEFCSSEKHTARRKERQNPPMRDIVSITYIGEEECQCILIDHPDHTYISNGFIPTHNTTIARIMADTLNDGKGEPIEIDAASHGSIDSVRDIVDQAKQYPVGINYKVFIIDEVHSLSNAAWQVMLKTLEESPAKSVFVLCTTNPEKIPATILSRVQVFHLSKISLSGIDERLHYVLDSEIAEGRKITYDDSAVNFIAKLANGGMRDALTLMDKALAYNDDITLENISKALNLPNYDDYFDLLQAYAKRDNQTVTRIIDRVYNSGVNFVTWFEEFHAFVINVVKYIFLKDIHATLIPEYYENKISKYDTRHSIICLRLADKLLKLNYDLKYTQYLQETAMTYLCSTKEK